MDIKRQLKIKFFGYFVMGTLLMASFGLREAVSEDIDSDYSPSALTLIKAKSPSGVMTAAGRFTIASSSKIFGVQGKPLSIRELPVPCMAKVRVEPGRYGLDPQVLRIQIQEVLPGAITDWKPQSPE